MILVAFESVEYVPEGQGVQKLELPVEYVPEGHEVHEDEPDVE